MIVMAYRYFLVIFQVTDLGITLLENWYCYQIVTTPTINFKVMGLTRLTLVIYVGLLVL